MNIPIVFFDIGSTLMDGPPRSPASRFVHELGLSKQDKETINNFLFTRNIETPDELTETFRRFFNDMPADADRKIKKIWDLQYEEGYAIEGAFTMLQRVAAAGFKLGIISNIWKPYFICFERLFEKYMDLFQVLILSYQVGAVKPDPGNFKRAMAGFGRYDEVQGLTSPYRACVVGDSYYHDMQPAMDLGMRSVWVLRNQDRELPYLRDVLLKKIPFPNITVPELNELLGEKFNMLRTLLESPGPD